MTYTKNLSHRAMYVGLTLRVLEVNRADREITERVEDEYDAARGSMTVTKKLVPPTYLSSLNSIRTMARNTHNKLTISTDIRNLRILPTTLYDKHSEAMNKYNSEFFGAVRLLESQWEHVISDVAPAFLKRALKPGELPTVEQLPTYFSFDLSYKPIPDNFKDWRLEGIEPDEATYIRANASNDTDYMWEEAAKEVYGRAHAVMHNFVELIKKTDSKNSIREATMENLREFAEIFNGLNIWGDEKMNAAYEQMLAFVNLSAEEIRSDEALRKDVEKRTDNLKDLLAKFANR